MPVVDKESSLSIITTPEYVNRLKSANRNDAYKIGLLWKTALLKRERSFILKNRSTSRNDELSIPEIWKLNSVPVLVDNIPVV